MERPQPREFGKRIPAEPPPHTGPVKRSRHVALLLMGTLAVGGGAFAMMVRGNCEPNRPGMAGSSLPQGDECRGGSGGHGGSGGSWSRSNFLGGDSASTRSSSAASSETGSGEVTRGGFGGFARAFAAHFSGS